MSVMFSFKGRQVSKAGIIQYVFKSQQYALTIYAETDDKNQIKVLYPVTVKAKGTDLDIAPDMSVIGEKKAEICPPPSIPIEKVPVFQKYLDETSAIVCALKKLIRQVEDGFYEENRENDG